MSYCPVHNHSEYSALDGLSTCKEIAQRSSELGYEAVGLSDHGTVAGHLDFARACKDSGVKPLFACELFHGVNSNPSGPKRDQAHFLAGALTSEGLRNLWRLVDASAHFFWHRPRVNWDTLAQYSEGLFATTACIQGLVSQELKEGKLDSLNKYLEIFKDNLYIELHTYPTEEQEWINRELLTIAEEKGIPTTIASDAHFAWPEQYEIHDAYLAIQTKQDVYTDPSERKMWHPKSLYIQSEDEIRQNLSYLPSNAIDEALSNGEELGRRVDAELPAVRKHLPAFIPRDCPWLDDKDITPRELFINLIEEGLIKRYGEDAPAEVWERAEKEMRVFLDAHLEDYFLQTWDFCQFCKENDIRRGPGRGSAGGAIVAYALEITDIDPLYYDLKFERFYNPGRETSLPDIDNDFPTAKRKDVRKYMMKRWGEKNVMNIGTVTRMKPKAACDTSWYAMGVTFSEKEELKKIISKIPDLEIHGSDTIGWSKEIDPGKAIYVMDNVGKEVEEWLNKAPVKRQPILKHWLDVLAVICSRVQHYGMHPSGTVISDVPLDAELPSRWIPKLKTFVTQFPMVDIEARQFLKQDYLGLRNLDTIEEWERMKGKVEWPGLEYQEHPEEMWELLDQGLTLGIFQIEDGYARRLCKEIQPRSVEELGMIVALNRPGPKLAHTPDSFIARRIGAEDIEYDHPILEPILEPTYGHFLYQEQIIDFMGALGYTPSEADEVRKILGKKKRVAMQDFGLGRKEWKGKGYLEMADKAGLSEKDARVIWEKLEGFASYSFNKSHAIAYATLAFRTLYAKYQGPAEFIIALLRTNPEEAGAQVMEGRRMGIEVKAPEIDRSGVSVEVVDGEILFGLANILHVGKDTAKYVISLRDRYDLTSPEKLYEAVEAEQKVWEAGDKKGRSPRQRFRGQYETMYDAGCWDNYEQRTISTKDRQKLEKELLKVVLTDNSQEVFDKNQDRIEECHDYAELVNGVAKLRLPGVIMEVKEIRTKKDRKAMGAITIEYEGEQAEFVVFPKHWQSYKFLWKERTPGLFDLVKTERGLHFSSGVKLS